jgi:hypothetical protein
VQVDVVVVDPGVQPERGRVEPQVAVGQLHALGPGRGARGVVDGRGGPLVAVPGHRFAPGGVELAVVGPDHDGVLDLDGVEQLLALRVDQQDVGARVLHDVADLGLGQPEVHRHQDPAPAAHPEERHQQPGRVVRHDGDPGADRHAELVEPGRLRGGQPGDVGVAELAER